MRSRNVKPGFFQNEKLVEFSPETRLLFIGLWLMADRAGRLKDRPKRIKMQVFPADAWDVEPMLAALHGAGLIVRYEAIGTNVRYIEIPKFLVHQRPHSKETPSVIPPRCVAAPTLVGAGTDLGSCSSVLIPDTGYLNPDTRILDPDTGSPPPPAKVSKRKVAGAMKLPDDFAEQAQASAGLKKKADSLGLVDWEVEEELEDFVRYWTKEVAGKKKDWIGTFRRRLTDQASRGLIGPNTARRRGGKAPRLLRDDPEARMEIHRASIERAKQRDEETARLARKGIDNAD